ncbi:MAG: hypothetical protein MJZ38_00945 [archaeon]|nr:hypothetical protein [archaeon]
MDKHPEFSYSWYFNFYDERNDLTAFMRIGNKPNKDNKDMFFFIVEKDCINGMRSAVAYEENARTRCSGLEFVPNDDGSWHITYQGPMADYRDQSKISMVGMDIVWTPVNKEMDYKQCVTAEGAALSSKVASEHFEQFGKAKGTLKINDRCYTIEATGERDRSEGVREWGSPKMWYWLNSVYDGEIGFDVTKLCTEMGDVDAGYFGTEKCNDPLVKHEIDTQYTDGIPSSFTIRSQGKSGRAYEVKGEVIRHAALPMAPGMMLVETISRTVYNGRTGYGIAEFLVRM